MEHGGEGLVSRVEDEFLITISDGEMAAVHTAGGLGELVREKLDGPAAAMANRAFFRTTQAVAECAGVPRHIIVAETLLEPLLPPAGREAQWKRIGERTGLVFPPLVHSKKWKDRFMLFSMAIAAVPVLALWWSLDALGWLPGIFFWLFSGPAFIAWVVLISRIHRRFLLSTPRLAVELPYESAGELASAVLALNMEAIEEVLNKEDLSQEAIWRRMTVVLSEQLKMPPGMLDENTEIRQPLRAK